MLGNGGPNHVATVEALVKAGADTDIKDRQGATALAYATPAPLPRHDQDPGAGHRPAHLTGRREHALMRIVSRWPRIAGLLIALATPTPRMNAPRSLSDPAGPHHRPVPGRRTDRRDGAAGRAEAHAIARTGHHREPAGRRQHRRAESGRDRRTGRPHLDVRRPDDAERSPDHVEVARYRSAERICADRRGLRHAVRADRAAAGRGADGAGA